MITLRDSDNVSTPVEITRIRCLTVLPRAGMAIMSFETPDDPLYIATKTLFPKSNAYFGWHHVIEYDGKQFHTADDFARLKAMIDLRNEQEKVRNLLNTL